MKRFVFLFVILFVVSLVASVPLLYVPVQEQYARSARDRVERLLRDKSSTLSKSIANRIGDYKSVEIFSEFPHVIWRRAMVDGYLMVGQKRYWFRIIDQDGRLKVESLGLHQDGSKHIGEVLDKAEYLGEVIE